jgi:predicted transcriptional regulator
MRQSAANREPSGSGARCEGHDRCDRLVGKLGLRYPDNADELVTICPQGIFQCDRRSLSEIKKMADTAWNDEELRGFHDAVQSLKLYRRAELQDDQTGESMIEALYVDPLPNEHVLRTICKPNTTFIVGRKGTGKSTIFQRAQQNIRQMARCVSVYVDIKTVYESSIADSDALNCAGQETEVLNKQLLDRLSLHLAFLTAVIDQIRKELTQRVRSTLWESIKERFTGSVELLFEGLDELLADARTPQFRNVVGAKKVVHRKKDSEQTANESRVSGGVSAGTDEGVSVGVKATGLESMASASAEQIDFAEVLIRTFNVTELIRRLQNLLETVNVRHLFVFIDDFSELPLEAMEVVVDALLAPLNNWSNELVKFKIAAYPGRIYYGQIDKTKVDEIFLDTFSLYGVTDASAMEEKAIDFTRRLVQTRVARFCDGASPAIFLETSHVEFWQSLFFASMANPRILGYLLFYMYETHLLYGRKAGVAAVRDAARKYYEDKLEPYFRMNRFLHQTFGERSSVLGMRELLEAIVQRSRELRSHDSEVIKKISGRPPTSHFHVICDIEGLLSTLELNFFLTKYYEMADRDGRKVSVYALNYGLCQKNTIGFGRPKGEREFRLYFVERFFDFTPILQRYIESNQEISCESCGEAIEIGQLAALKLFGMLCPKCKHGTCRVVNLTQKYKAMLDAIDHELLLPATDLGILQTLHSEKRALFAADIAGELDCSHQLVGKRGKNLDERGLVKRSVTNEAPNYGRRQFELTRDAEEIYFKDVEDTPDDA